jgi:flagellar hook-associated protein 2
MSSNTISAANLDPTFRTIIQQTLEAERQPLKRLTARRDELQVQKAVYTDLSNLLNSLQSTLRSLISSQLTYTLGGSRSVKVTPTVAGSTVLSASAGSSAAAGSYEISVISLAKAHRVRSDAVEYINQALGLSGTLRLGGLAAAQVSGAALADGVTGFETSLPLDGKSALGSDAYYVETRQQDGVWQFRLVNSRGEAQFIRRSDGSYTSEWQNAPVEAGWVDTGRGLKIEFDPSALQARTRSSGASSVNYTPQGAAITVSASDSLVDIAAKINQAAYAEGNRVSAAVINNHLVLTHQRSGAGVLLQAADESGTVLEALGILQGGTFKTVLQTPSDAVFTVNGLTVQRGRNDKLSDVINGVSLSLSADAEGKSATLTIEDDLSADIKAVQTFLDQFNALQKYLSEKTATVKNSDNTYTRGALVGDSMFRSLRFDLLRQFEASYTTGQAFTRLNDLGLKLDSDLKASLSDRNALENALRTDRNAVKALLDAAMGALETRLSQFTGENGYLKGSQKSLESQMELTNKAIERMNERLAQREQTLIQQFAEMQTQMTLMLYTSQQMNSIYGSLYRSG